MKKIKLNKKFQACPFDSGDELFPNGIFEFNITKLTAFIQSNPTLFFVEQVPVEVARSFPSNCLNEDTIKTADVTVPIILAEISPGRFNVIDGNHRLERAHRDGLTAIQAYRVRPDHHIQFFTSEEAYVKYVQYWNSKVKYLVEA